MATSKLFTSMSEERRLRAQLSARTTEELQRLVVSQTILPDIRKNSIVTLAKEILAERAE